MYFAYFSSKMDPTQVKQLRTFVDICKANPAVLHMPELQFYRTYLERWANLAHAAQVGDRLNHSLSHLHMQCCGQAVARSPNVTYKMGRPFRHSQILVRLPTQEFLLPKSMFIGPYKIFVDHLVYRLGVSGQTIMLNDRSDRSKPLRSIIDRKANLRSIICRFS